MRALPAAVSEPSTESVVTLNHGGDAFGDSLLKHLLLLARQVLAGFDRNLGRLGHGLL